MEGLEFESELLDLLVERFLLGAVLLGLGLELTVNFSVLVVGFFEVMDQLLVLFFKVNHSLQITLISTNDCRLLLFAWIAVFRVVSLKILIKLGLE